jgi:hypothetical protein
LVAVNGNAGVVTMMRRCTLGTLIALVSGSAVVGGSRLA